MALSASAAKPLGMLVFKLPPLLPRASCFTSGIVSVLSSVVSGYASGRSTALCADEAGSEDAGTVMQYLEEQAVEARTQGDDTIFACDKLHVDFAHTAVFVDGERLALKAMEYKLLVYLVKNRNHVVTKDEIFREVWEQSITTDNTLNVHIRHLREKIEDNPNEPRYIKTVWGTGYIFEAAE